MRTIVLHAFGRMDRGGAETRTLELMRELHDSVDMRFATLSAIPGDFDDEIRQLGGEVYVCAGLMFPIRFVRLLRRTRPDVVHSHLATFSGLLMMLAWLARVPVRVSHFRSDNDGHSDSWRRKIQRGVMVQLMKFHATHIIGVTPVALANGYGAKWARDSRCQVIPNGLSTARFREAVLSRAGLAWKRKHNLLETVGPILVHVGRPGPAKNRIRLVSILAEVKQVSPGATLVLIGRRDPEEDRSIRKVAHALDVWGSIIMPGLESDVAPALSAADVFVLPSVQEGLPGALLEACILGLPAVVSDLPGCLQVAARFPNVASVSLDSEDACWARALNCAQRRTPDEERMLQASDEFDSSEYSLRSSAERFLKLWSGG